MNNAFETYWGIDVSKEWLDIAIEGSVSRIGQTKAAVKNFIKKNKADTEKILAVLESTGGYEQLVACCLSEAGIVVHIAHPNKVKAFTRAKGRLAKTDKIDAQLLKEYGSFINLSEIRELPSEMQTKLQSLGSRLGQLKAMHHQESCRLGIAFNGLIKKSINGMLRIIKKEIKEVQESILALINADTELKEKFNLLRSMKGVGPALAMILITDLPELGEANKKEIAVLVGVAPITNQSGQKTGKAITKYGRSSVRKTLYMAALTASRHNVKLAHFYEKLREKGKQPKVALVAVMRKMIVILNAMAQAKKHFVA